LHKEAQVTADDRDTERNDAGPAGNPEADTRIERTAGGLTGRSWLLLIAVLAILLLLLGRPVLRGNSTAQELQQTVPAANVSSIEISVSSPAVNITRAAGSEIEVNLNGAGARAFELRVDETGPLLRINVSRPRTFLNFWTLGGVTLDVALPAGEYDLLRAGSSSGAIRASDFRAEEARFSSSSGSITVMSGQVAGTLQASSSSGRVSLQQVAAGGYELSSSSGRLEAHGVSGALRATSSSGSIDIRTDEIRSGWTLQTSSGSVTVTLGQVPEALRVEYQGSSGGWNAPGDWGLNISHQARNQLSAQIGSGGPLLRVTTSSGSFTLR
jgi:hypothetical protein